MAIKRFCDACGAEMPEAHKPQILFRREVFVGTAQTRVHIEVKTTRAVNGTWNGGDVCTECIQLTVAEGTVTEVRDGA